MIRSKPLMLADGAVGSFSKQSECNLLPSNVSDPHFPNLNYHSACGKLDILGIR